MYFYDKFKKSDMVKLELFDLIHSMTMSEKRYFKIFSSKHVIGDKNDYVQLFDTIDKMEFYDEEILIKKPFVKNLSAEKNYLHKLILKSLNAFHLDLNSKTKIYSLLQSIEILYHKGLYSQAEKLCRKVLVIAKEKELFAHILSINEILIELLSKQFKYQEVIELIEDSKVFHGKLSNFRDIQSHTMKAYHEQWNLGYARTDEEGQILKSYVDHKEINNPKFPQSKRAEMYLLGLNLTYAFFINDLDKMISLSVKMNDLYEENIALIEFSTIGYIASLYNTANAYLKNKDFSKALEITEKLEKLKTEFGIANSHNLGARVFFYSTNLKLDIYLKMDDFAAAKYLVDDLNQDFIKFKNNIATVHLYEFYFLMSKYYFVIADYRAALRYSNNVINDSSITVRKDLLSVIRLLNLLIHYELKNDFTIEYLTKNTFNYFKSKKRLFKVENELIKFISGRNKDTNNEVLKADLEQLQHAMQSHKKDPNEQIPFSYFDFEYWAISKLTKKALRDF